MKLFRRYLSLLLCLPLLFGLFSFPATASSYNAGDLKVNIYGYSANANFGQINIMNGQNGQNTKRLTPSSSWQNKDYYYYTKFTFVNSNGGSLFKEGKTYEFTASDLFVEVAYTLPNDSQILNQKPSHIYDAYVIYNDGSTSDAPFTAYSYTYNDALASFSLTGTLEPNKDVYKIVFVMVTVFRAYSDMIGTTCDYEMTFGTSGRGLNIVIDTEDETLGFLESIVQWIKDIFDSISDGFTNVINYVHSIFETVENGFASIGTWFAELPGKIWEFIENGLKSLFVPDSDFISSQYDLWINLISSRLGAVYEVVELTLISWDDMLNSDLTDTIEIPLVTLHFGKSEFSFGGQSVQIVPDGFQTLVEACKLIIGITCTYLFVNGLYKRYEEVMGVEK